MGISSSNLNLCVRLQVIIRPTEVGIQHPLLGSVSSTALTTLNPKLFILCPVRSPASCVSHWLGHAAATQTSRLSDFASLNREFKCSVCG